MSSLDLNSDDEQIKIIYYSEDLVKAIKNAWKHFQDDQTMGVRLLLMIRESYHQNLQQWSNDMQKLDEELNRMMIKFVIEEKPEVK